ncbi:MAG TPA: 5-oxoprolinase subunit PxpB [Gemmatimonadaceae bacterium]
MTIAPDTPVIARLGDGALIVTLGDTVSWDVGTRVRAAADRIRAMHPSSVTDVVPAYTTLAVYFDSTQTSFEVVADVVTRALSGGLDTPLSDARLIEIPVRYDGADLSDVAERTGLTVADVIERHCSRTYRAYMSGFVPGFTYLGDLDRSLVLPRRITPRLRVPAGSVAIAGEQTAVYPLDTPGGWHLIGTTDVKMFDATRVEPALLRPGDSVRFVNTNR